MEHYFLNFPLINYEGFAATNITLRPYIRKVFKDNYSLFYNYIVPEGHRADKVAHDLYGKSEYVWIIYLFNDIIDPYYDWPLSEENFRAMLVNKYGTVEEAQRKITSYRSNWYNDSSTLDVGGFSALSSTLKKFWKPQILPGNKVYQYVRKDVDITRTTNKILQFSISLANTSLSFTPGEYANQGAGNGSQVAFSNSSTLVLKHIVGSFSNSSSITGANSGASATITSSINTTNVVASEETSYFSPVYAYDVEQEENVRKAHIRLVRPGYVATLEEKLNEVLNG